MLTPLYTLDQQLYMIYDYDYDMNKLIFQLKYIYTLTTLFLL